MTQTYMIHKKKLLKLVLPYVSLRCTNRAVCGVLHQSEDVRSALVVPSGNRRQATKVSKHPCIFLTVSSDVD